MPIEAPGVVVSRQQISKFGYKLWLISKKQNVWQKSHTMTKAVDPLQFSRADDAASAF
jgi:hypothetical protein